MKRLLPNLIVAALTFLLSVPMSALAQYEPEAFFEIGGSRPKSSAVGDFNGDGFDDQVVSFNEFPQLPNGQTNVTGNATTKLVFLMGSADNELLEGGSVSFPAVASQSSLPHRELISGDFNGDGLADVGVITKKLGPLGDYDNNGPLPETLEAAIYSPSDEYCGDRNSLVIFNSTSNGEKPQLSHWGCVELPNNKVGPERSGVRPYDFIVTYPSVYVFDLDQDGRDDLIIDNVVHFSIGQGVFFALPILTELLGLNLPPLPGERVAYLWGNFHDIDTEFTLFPQPENWFFAADYNNDGLTDFGRMDFREGKDPLFGVSFHIPAGP